jgi:hypothetical protein
VRVGGWSEADDGGGTVEGYEGLGNVEVLLQDAEGEAFVGEEGGADSGFSALEIDGEGPGRVVGNVAGGDDLAEGGEGVEGHALDFYLKESGHGGPPFRRR